MIWKLNFPNKIKHFMWRACKNILPTKNRLKVRGMGLEDCCAVCGLSETSGHTLRGCEFAKKVWSTTKIKLPWLPDPLRDFIDLVWVVMESHSNIDWVKFAVIAWSLCNNRNTIVNGGQGRGQEALTRFVTEFIDEFKQDHHTPIRVVPVALQLWTPPQQG